MGHLQPQSSVVRNPVMVQTCAMDHWQVWLEASWAPEQCRCSTSKMVWEDQLSYQDWLGCVEGRPGWDLGRSNTTNIIWPWHPLGPTHLAQIQVHSLGTRQWQRTLSIKHLSIATLSPAGPYLVCISTHCVALWWLCHFPVPLANWTWHLTEPDFAIGKSMQLTQNTLILMLSPRGQNAHTVNALKHKLNPIACLPLSLDSCWTVSERFKFWAWRIFSFMCSISNISFCTVRFSFWLLTLWDACITSAQTKLPWTFSQY